MEAAGPRGRGQAGVSVRGVRFTADGWDGQCDECRQWWPLEADSWVPRTGLRRCRACVRETSRRYVAALRDANPEMRARHRAQSRENQGLKRAIHRDAYLEYQRRWFAANHVRLNAEAAERHSIKTELAGFPVRTSPREETPETLAYRAAFRTRWIAKHGPIVNGSVGDAATRQREYKREWMRAKRAAEKAA